MSAVKGKIERNLHRIREDIAEACRRAGRSPGEVSILAVTKTVGLGEVQAAVELGLTELAESRAQQLSERAEELSAWLSRRQGGAAVRWHMIGHLQRNKVKLVMERAEVIHSVDSLRLAEEIDERAERLGRRFDVLVQVNCSQEPQKFGCAVGAAAHLVELMQTLKSLRVLGLMTMGPLSASSQDARPSFTRLKELFDEIRHHGTGGPDFRHLSMGMSQDYAVAVEEGATMLRIGTALFA